MPKSGILAAAGNSKQISTIKNLFFNKNETKKPTKTSNTQTTLNNIESSEAPNFSTLTTNLNTALNNYIKRNSDHLKRTLDVLKDYYPESTFTKADIKNNKLPPIKDVEDLEKFLNAFLARVKKDTSDLHTEISKFLSENKLGKIIWDASTKHFTVALSEQMKSLLAQRKLSESLQAVNNTDASGSISAYSTSLSDKDEGIGSSPSTSRRFSSQPCSIQEEKHETDRLSVSIASNNFSGDDNKAVERHSSASSSSGNPFIDTDEEEESNNPFLGSEERSKSNSYLSRQLSSISPSSEDSFKGNKKENNAADYANSSPISLESESSAYKKNPTKAEYKNIGATTLSAAPQLFELLTPVFIEKKNEQHRYKDSVKSVGTKNGQRVLIDFNRLNQVHKDFKEITNLVQLQRLMEEAESDKNRVETINKILESTKLDEIIFYKNIPSWRETKHRTEFIQGFDLTTMQSANFTSFEEKTVEDKARNAILLDLNTYRYDGEKRRKKIESTLKKENLRDILMMTKCGEIKWIDQETWPKNSNDFDNLLRMFHQYHGKNQSSTNTTSTLLKALQKTIASVPKTQIANQAEKKNIENIGNMVHNGIHKIDKIKTDNFIFEQIIAYGRHQKVDNIDTFVAEYISREFEKNSLDKKIKSNFKIADKNKLASAMPQSSFARWWNSLQNTFTSSKKSANTSLLLQHSENFDKLQEEYQAVFKKNVDMIFTFYNAIDKNIIRQVNDILVNTDKSAAFGNKISDLNKKLSAECTRQIDIKIAKVLADVDASLTFKINASLNRFEILQTNESGEDFREWFTTFQEQINTYKACSAERLAYVNDLGWTSLDDTNNNNLSYLNDNNLSDLFDKGETIKSIARFHEQHLARMQSTFYQAIESAINKINFDGKLRSEIHVIMGNRTLSRVDKADQLNRALIHYSERVHEAISLIDRIPELKQFLTKFKNEQQKSFSDALELVKKFHPKPLSRWGRIKQALFGEAKKLAWWEHITKGFSSARKAVFGLGFLAGGAALGLGIASAAGAGIFTLIFAPVMVPVITFGLIAIGSAVLLGIAGYSINKLGHTYGKVRSDNERIKAYRDDSDILANKVSNLLGISADMNKKIVATSAETSKQNSPLVPVLV